jgi:hypothetical protein
MPLLTQSLISQRKFAEAEGFARESLAIREGSTPDDWRTFNSRSLLGLGRFGEAEPLLLSAYEGMKQQEHRIPAAGKPQISETLQRLVQLHETTDRSAKAAEWSLKLAELHPPSRIANEPRPPSHDWPQWRGPDRYDVSRETGLLDPWPENGPPLLWTLTGLGEGIPAMAVADGTTYTLGYRDDTEFLFALDAATGESRWVPPVGTVTNFRSGAFNSLMRGLSPRVPTVDGDRIYTITAEGELTCVGPVNGRSLWRKHYSNDYLSPPRFWGFYDYPLVDGDNLICAPGGVGATVVALNKRTGELVWKTGVPGGEPGTHGAAVLSTAGGIRHTVVFLNSGPMGIAADDGRVLWRYERGAGRSVSYTPVIRDDLVFAPSGYGWGMALLKVELASPAYSYKLALHRLRPTSSAKLSGSIHGAPAGGSSESP